VLLRGSLPVKSSLRRCSLSANFALTYAAASSPSGTGVAVREVTQPDVSSMTATANAVSRRRQAPLPGRMLTGKSPVCHEWSGASD
jgi:hypothetical protein